MTEWIVSVSGTSTGAGTLADPIDIETIIDGIAQPGDIISLRGTPIIETPTVDARGIYTSLVKGTTGLNHLDGVDNVAGKGVFDFKIHGTSDNLITFRSYPGEKAKLSGAFHMINGKASYIRMQNIECAPIPTTRVYLTEANVTCPSLYMTGAGCQFINCYFHEYPVGYFYPAVIVGTNIVHGCIMGNVGMYLSTRNPPIAGYCMYTHNAGGSDFPIQKNAFFGSVHEFNINPHTTAAKISAYQIDDNLLFGGGIAL